MNAKPLSPIEAAAMLWLQQKSSIMVNFIPDATESSIGAGGQRIQTPGWAVFQRLEKMGLCFMTEETLIYPEHGPDSQTWTPSMDITDEGKAWRPSDAVLRPDPPPKKKRAPRS